MEVVIIFMKLNKLTKEEEGVILRKGTEMPFSGKYDHVFKSGEYRCRQCDALLYVSQDKFDSGCGWPSFDDEVKGAVKRVPDESRTEIQCARCGGHLGHVFEGERLTQKNVRHCVNSVSLRFVPRTKKEVIVLGGGCFWCTEAVFSMIKGVLKITVGYAGGTPVNPTYEQVCSGRTGHAEVIQIEYDPAITLLSTILDVFFSSHDPTLINQQGNDMGTQYRSVVFYTTLGQKEVVEMFILGIQKKFEKQIVTEVKQLETFYPAEDYHQQYYKKNPNKPYCLAVIKPKMEKVEKNLGEKVKS